MTDLFEKSGRENATARREMLKLALIQIWSGELRWKFVPRVILRLEFDSGGYFLVLTIFWIFEWWGGGGGPPKKFLG